MTPGMFIRLVLASGTFIKPVLTSGMFIRCKLTSGMFIRSVMTPGMFTDLYWHQVYNKNAALYWVRQGIIQNSFHRTLWHLFCVSLIDPQPQFFFCRDKWPVVTDCFLCTPACSFFWLHHRRSPTIYQMCTKRMLFNYSSCEGFVFAS